MPEYYFNARDPQGKALSGQRKAGSAEELASQLIGEGFIPLDISASTDKPTKRAPASRLFVPKVTLDDLHMFCRQMYSLLHAGIPVSFALIRLSETTRNKTLIDALQKIVATLNKGSSLNVAMGHFPNIFSDFFISLIVIGESTGNLDNIFLHLAEYVEMEVDITKKIKAALRYPIMVMGAIVVALLVINVFVMPAVAKLYSNMHGTLPLPTRVLLNTSNFIIHYWYLLLGGILLTIFSIKSYIRSPKGAVQWGKWQFKIPVLGWLIQRILITRFARLLSLVLRAGITAFSGIQMVGVSTSNAYMAQQIEGVTDLISKGNTISAALEKTQLFPPLIMQMILLGEESGTIDSLLDEAAEYYQREIDYDLGRLADIIEPVLLLVIGGMVLILALGVFLPMWNLASLLKPQ